MAEILPNFQKITKNEISESPVLVNEKKIKEIEEKDLIFEEVLTKDVLNPIWLSVSEAAKIGGVQNKTIRRAIQAKTIKYKIVGNRYIIELSSVIKYMYTSKKLKNKLQQNGLGQYIIGWRK